MMPRLFKVKLVVLCFMQAAAATSQLGWSLYLECSFDGGLIRGEKREILYHVEMQLTFWCCYDTVAVYEGPVSSSAKCVFSNYG